MLEIRDLLKKTKETMNKDAFEEFAMNTIKACGYNSDTFELMNNVQGKVNNRSYNDKLLRNLKEYAKQNNVEEEKMNNIKLENNKAALLTTLDGIVEEEDLNSILFDLNVEIVDDLISYDKISGIDFIENIDNYLNDFKTGVDLIDHSDDYCHIKEDIYSDAGFSTIGLENIDKDTIITVDDLEEDEEELDYETEMIK